ncbi:MAG: hypothetical protein H7Y01_14400, partial [Ferruginibacter sp.]|nr:hypothetical protein [Chitinophagaceae bacterium]
KINFADDGASMSKVSLGLAYATNWTILKEAKLQFSNISIAIEVEPASPAGATGILSGNFLMAGTAGIQVSAALSKSTNDWKISANISDFSFAELLDNFSFTEAIFPNAAVFAKMMGTTNLGIDIFPFKQKLSMTVANTSFGTLNIQAERLEGADVSASTSASTRRGWGLLAGYSFPQGFAFNSDKVDQPWKGMLSFLDNVKSKTGIYFSTYEGEPASLLPVFEELGFEGPIYKGITFITGINISNGYQDLKRILSNTTFKKLLVSKDIPVENLTLQANLPMDPTQMRVEAALGFKESFNIGQVVWLKDIKLIFEANGGSPVFSLATNISVKVEEGKDPLNFYFKGSAEPSALTISGAGAMTNYWNNPYGFPVKIGKLLFGTGINFSYELPVLDNTIMSGEMEFGGVACEGTIGFDVNQLTKNFIQAKIANVDYKKITDFFCGPDIRNKISATPYLGTVLSQSRLDTAEIRLALQTFSLISYNIPKEITQGLEVKGKGKVYTWDGDFAFKLDGPQAGLNAGLSAHGKMKMIEIKEGTLTVFRIASASGKANPEFFVDLTANHVIKGIASTFLSGSAAPATPDRFVYVNGAINILEVASANMFMELTNTGYNCKMNGNIYGFLNGSVDAQIPNFSNPITSYVKVSANAGSLWTSLQNYLPKEVAVLGFGNDIWQELMKRTIRIESMNFEGSLDVLKKNAAVNMVYYIGNERKIVTVTIPVSTAANFFKAIAVEMAKGAKATCTSIQNAIVQAGTTVISGFQTTAGTVTTTARTAVTTATNEINALKNLPGSAATVYNDVKSKTASITGNLASFFNDFSLFNGSTIQKLFNKAKDQLVNYGNRAIDKTKAFFTGSDNEELLIIDGPSYWIHVKNKGQILKGQPTRTKNLQVNMASRSGTPRAEEIWQLIPADVEGTFYIVSAYNGLSITKPNSTHLILIPHESDHKDRERMMMEPVPNEPGWFYLKYRDRNTYMEVKNVAVNKVQQWVAAPVTSKPSSDYGKFRFEKAGDIDWTGKTFPPRINPAQPFSATAAYLYNETSQDRYHYSGDVFRLVPDVETTRAMGTGSWPLLTIPFDRRIGVTFGTPIASRKDGALIKGVNEAAVYIMQAQSRRHIPDIETFNDLGLKVEMIQTVPQDELSKIPLGAQLPSRLAVPVQLVEKALYHVPGDPTVYVIINNAFRGIPDPETLGFMGYNFGLVNSISAQDLGRLPKGTNLATRRNGALVQGTGTPEVYYMENGLRRWIPDGETFEAMRLSWSGVQNIGLADLNAIPKGADIASKK